MKKLPCSFFLSWWDNWDVLKAEFCHPTNVCRICRIHTDVLLSFCIACTTQTHGPGCCLQAPNTIPLRVDGSGHRDLLARYRSHYMQCISATLGCCGGINPALGSVAGSRPRFTLPLDRRWLCFSIRKDEVVFERRCAKGVLDHLV